MTTLFITEQGTRLIKSGYSLVVKRGTERIFLYPLEQIQQLVLVGRIEITSSLLGFLMQRGIDTVFLRQDGRFKGRVSGATGKNILVRQAQFRKRDDDTLVLKLSRALIYAKIHNTAYILRKLSHGTWEELRGRIRNALHSVERASTLDVLRGLEGSFSNLYFSRFPRLLKHDFHFRKRIKHPPEDPVNILLSFGYTLLFNSLFGLIEVAGLDPYAGFFHQTRYGHAALVSDIMEPFRAPVVDRLVIQILNNELITEEDFRREEGNMRLAPQAIQRFVTAYRNRLFTARKQGDRRVNLWQILQKEVGKFQNYLMGRTDEYQPYRFR